MKATTVTLATVVLATTMSYAQDKPSAPLTGEALKKRIEELVEMADPRSPEERRKDVEYRKKFGDAIVVDALTVGVPSFKGIKFTDEHFDTLASHVRETGLTAFNTTASNGSEGADPLFSRLVNTHLWIKGHSEEFMLIDSLDDFHTAKKEGKTGIALNSQSSDILDGDLKNVEKFYKQGVRQLNFTYNVDNMWAAGMMVSRGEKDFGLTEEGKALVKEMNRVGMLIDASHSSDETAIQAARLSSKPIILSHSNVAALYDIGRNSSDKAIRAVASTGGVIAVNFLGGFLNPEGDATPKSIAKHVDYIKQMVGAQAVAFGSDYVQNYAVSLEPIISNPAKYPPEEGYGTATHMAFPGDVWGVARILEEEHGWTESEIRGFLGENVLRIYEANWK